MVKAEFTRDGRSTSPDPILVDRRWMRLGYLIIFALLTANLAYLASGKLELSEDEAYYWLWSKHLALSYYSKPLLIAVTQFLGTSLWGSTTLGVRFFAPVIGAIISLVLLRFMARVANARASFWLCVAVPTVPLLTVGSILMTIDPLSVLFWTLAMTAGWRAIQDGSTTLDWFWVGLWMGLGFLSKQVELLQLLSWAVLFVLWPAARKQLRRPGPYVALLVNLVFTLPLVIWNVQHHWITARHVMNDNGRLDQPWSPTPATLWHCFVEFVLTFIGSETALLNPFFFIAVVWAAIAFWRKRREKPLLLYFFCMGAPLFLCCLLWNFHSRTLPNWIAPAILPLFCLAAVYWEERWRHGARGIKAWLFSGLIVGCIAVVLLRDTNLVTKLIGYRLPPRLDPTTRVRGWTETARVVEAARQKLLAEGKPVFIIGGHYGITAEVSFYDPEAHAGVPDHPLAYYRTGKEPENQFYYWPGYQDGNHKGQNAIYVQVLEFNSDKRERPYTSMKNEFESFTDLGPVFVLEDGHPIHRIQLMECRGLR